MKTALTLLMLLALIASPSFAQTSSPKKIRKHLQKGDTPFESMPSIMTKDSCGKVDLAPQLGPVHNQTAGTCFAYTALDLMNYGTDTRYSALHLATMKDYTPPDPNKPKLQCPGDPAPNPNAAPAKRNPMDEVGGFKGGQVAAAIKLGMDKGLCPESVVPSSDGGLKKDYKKLIEYYAEKADEECKETPDSTSRMVTQIEARNRNFDSREVRNEVRRMYPTLTERDVEEVAGQSTTVDDFIKRLNDRACQGNLSRNVPPGKGPSNVTYLANSFVDGCEKFYYQENRAPLLDKINKALDANKPVGISYVTGGLIQPPKETSHAFHASVLSGRAWLEEKRERGRVTQEAGCYYLVKNSWGPDWKVADGLKAKSSTKYPGYFVISEKQLMEHVYGAATID